MFNFRSAEWYRRVYKIINEELTAIEAIKHIKTPEEIAREMVEELPDSIFNENSKFLDPYCKSGIFLKLIIDRLLEKDIPLNHILKNQIYMVCEDSDLPIAISTILGGDRPVPFGAKKLINSFKVNPMEDPWALPEELNNMTFDLIIGNPPYNEDGVNQESKTIYPKFISEAAKHSKMVSFIIPARWMSNLKMQGAKQWKRWFLSGKHLSKIVYFSDSKKIFPKNSISGGICYFIYDKENQYEECELVLDGILDKRKIYDKEQIVLSGNSKLLSLFDKVCKDATLFETIVYPRNVFNIMGKGIEDRLSTSKQDGDIVVYHNHDKEYYINEFDLDDDDNLVDKYKLFVSKGGSSGKLPINAIRKYNPKSACSESNLVIAFNTKEEMDSCYSYMTTDLFQLFIKAYRTTQNLSRGKFRMPLVPFDRTWDNEKVYRFFNLTDEEIEIIQSNK